MMTSVHNNHIKFHKNQAINIRNSDFQNWIMGHMETHKTYY